jgi:predicted small integral membrane protein
MNDVIAHELICALVCAYCAVCLLVCAASYRQWARGIQSGEWFVVWMSRLMAFAVLVEAIRFVVRALCDWRMAI